MNSEQNCNKKSHILELIEEYCTPDEIPLISENIKEYLNDFELAKKKFWASIKSLDNQDAIELATKMSPIVTDRSRNRRISSMMMLTE